MWLIVSVVNKRLQSHINHNFMIIKYKCFLVKNHLSFILNKKNKLDLVVVRLKHHVQQIKVRQRKFGKLHRQILV